MLLALPNMMGAESTPACGEVEVLHAAEGGAEWCTGAQKQWGGTEQCASTAPWGKETSLVVLHADHAAVGTLTAMNAAHAATVATNTQAAYFTMSLFTLF